MKLTAWQLRAAQHIGSINVSGMGAIMTFAELIVAADELTDLGLAERRGDDQRRWLTRAGRAALSGSKDQ